MTTSLDELTVSVPRALAKLEDSLTAKFMVWLLADQEQYAKGFPQVVTCLNAVSGLYQRVIDDDYEPIVNHPYVRDSSWGLARSAAKQAGESTRLARYSGKPERAWAAEAAAECAAHSDNFAQSLWSASWAAAYGEAAYRAEVHNLVLAVGAESAARIAYYQRMADKLTELQEAAS